MKIKKNGFMRTFLFIPSVILFLILFLTAVVLGFSVILFVALFCLATPIGLFKLLGMFDNIVSDLTPLALFFAGIFSGAFSVFISSLLYLFFPYFVRLFRRAFDWYRIYDLR